MILESGLLFWAILYVGNTLRSIMDELAIICIVCIYL